MEIIKFVVQRVTYQNPENGYSVFQADVDGIGWQNVVGTFPDIGEGTTIVANGDWRNDKRYGRQFVVASWREELPSSVLGIENYIGSGLIAGIGKSMAKQIVSHFGQQTLEVLDKNPQRLLEVSGIGRKRLKKIQDSWVKQKGVKDVMVFLQGHGISAAYAAKIYKEYGKDSIQKVKENPYCLADDIFGIGFKKADDIASRMGYEKNDMRRCKAGIIYTLNQLAIDGHCYMERCKLIKEAMELLAADERPITEAMSAMELEQGIILDGEDVFLPMYYYSEVGVAKKLGKLIDGKIDDADKVDIEKAVSEKSKTTYDEVQIEAIRQAVKSKVMVLTGGPGCGKTFTTNGIIRVFESLKKTVICAAPTGRAAKRMSEATGKDAKTIHRLLEYKPQEGFSRNEDHPLSGDVLIVDESSMIDIMLMNSLMKAVPQKMRLILVGDIDQLPSVGAGNVLRDIIDSGVVPVVRLTRIFRQAQASRIVTNAHKINQGTFPDVSNGKESDFFFIQQDDPDAVAAEIVNLAKNRIPKAYNYGIGDIQVLAPMRRGVVGTISLNIALQEAINPVGECISYGSFKYRRGDKVMQIKNNYDKDVFNGDIGVVECVNTDENTMTVSFDGKAVEYEKGDFGELTLAYATTIHKSQGSEYPVVVMPLMMSHYVMLQRNLVYTGVTRAKKLCIIIGESKALSQSIRNMVVLKRNTKLKERLNENMKSMEKVAEDSKSAPVEEEAPF